MFYLLFSSVMLAVLALLYCRVGFELVRVHTGMQLRRTENKMVELCVLHVLTSISAIPTEMTASKLLHVFYYNHNLCNKKNVICEHTFSMLRPWDAINELVQSTSSCPPLSWRL